MTTRLWLFILYVTDKKEKELQVEPKKARVLLYDIETAPILGAVWGKYEQNLVWSDQDWYMLCFAYKWLGDKTTHVVAQPDFKNWKPGSEDDSEVVKALHALFEEADIVIAHNGNSFDQKKSQARMIINGLMPPAPYKQIDTKIVAKRYFNFTSNKLDDLGVVLGLGRKLETGGYELWKGCMGGDKKSWKKMKQYNKQDVVLLEQVYMKLRPWITNHPNMARITNRPEACPKCNVPGRMESRGFRVNTSSIYRKYQCKACGGWCSRRVGEGKDVDVKPSYVNFNG